MRRCFLLLIDGLRPDVAEAELAAGRLPNLARLVASGGAGRAITSFPSTTSVSYLPFLTGCTPGRCNVPSIRWLDRSRYDGRWWRSRDAIRSYCGYQAGMLDDDIDPAVRTIFELVPASVGIFTMISRGLPLHRNPARVERQFWGALAHYAEWHQPSDEAVATHLQEATERPEAFVFAQFPAVDGYTHQSDPGAPRVLRSLARVDEVIGRLLKRLAARNELPEGFSAAIPPSSRGALVAASGVGVVAPAAGGVAALGDLSGTGVSDYGDVLLLPGTRDHAGRAAPFDKASERVRAFVSSWRIRMLSSAVDR